MKKLLFLGDIVGSPGRDLVCAKVPELREKLGLNWIVVNGENAAGGSGITRKLAREIIAAGVDGITLGDHVWDQRHFESEIDSMARICRPANLMSSNPGASHLILNDTDGARLLVFTVLGRQFMKTKSECMFDAADRLLSEFRGEYDYSLVEIHAETTSEKIALGWHLDGRASLVVGTHTHVATADATVLPNGTAFQTDAGMCGPHRGVLGRDIESVVTAMRTGMPRRFPVAESDVRLNGCLVSLNENGTAAAISRFEMCA